MRKPSVLAERFDSFKLIVFNLISLTLLILLGVGAIAYEAVTLWHLVQQHMALK